MLVYLAAALAVSAVLWERNRQLTKPVTETEKGGHPNDRATGPHQMLVDKPTNTSLRNEAAMINGELSNGVAGTIPANTAGMRAVERHLDSVAATEAALHPGVGLVAKSVGV